MISGLDQAVIAIYMLAMVGLGVWASKKVHSNEDYALAGKALSFPVLTGSLIGTIIGGVATMGNSGKAYEAGYVVFVACFSYFAGYLALAYIAPRLRKANIESVPQALERRFGIQTRLIASVVVLIAAIIFFTAQLIAFGLIASMVLAELGVSYEIALVVGAVVIVLYTLVGGLLAVAYTDMLQTLVMLIGIGALLPVFLTLDVGGWDSATDLLVAPQSSFFEEMSPGFLLALVPTYFAMVLIDPAAWQRIAAAKESHYLRPALLSTAVVYLLWSLLIVGLGVVAYNLYPGLDSPDAVIPTLILGHMPEMVKGLCLVAILAILMSSADSLLLIAGTTVTRDILGVVKPGLSDHRLLTINRSVIFSLGVIGILVALSKVSLFNITVVAYGIFVAGLFIPMMAALFMPKISSSAAIVSGISGSAVVVVANIMVLVFQLDIAAEPVLWGLGASCFMLIVANKITQSSSDVSVPLLTTLNKL